MYILLKKIPFYKDGSFRLLSWYRTICCRF